MSKDIEQRFAELIVPVPVDRMFTYSIPDEFLGQVIPGKRVIVQFGSRKFYTAIVFRLLEKAPDGITPKPIETVLDDEPLISENYLHFWKWLSEYYLCAPGDVLKTALPSGLRIESETRIELNPSFSTEMLPLLHQHEQMIALVLQEKPDLCIQDIQKMTGVKHVQHLVKNLISKGVAIGFEEYGEKYIPKVETTIRLSDELAGEETKLELLLNTLEKKAPKQCDVLMAFIHETTIAGNTPELLKKKLMKRCSYPALQAVIKKGYLTEHEKIVSRFAPSDDKAKNYVFTLSDKQQSCLDQIHSEFEKHQVVLLHGITSSGKTEIYIKLIEETIARGEQVLYLLPEIALTAQIIQRLKGVFGEQVGIYHHKFNYHEKIELWSSVKDTKPQDSRYRIILGTRSAIFLPFSKPGLIIIDEEHDSSYKQMDVSPHYHARDAAVYLAHTFGIKTLLGTATPSVETQFNAISGRFGFCKLFSRYQDLPLPQVKIVNMATETKSRKGAWYISFPLREAITDALSKGNQIILFQNRRGFVPVVECTDCGWTPGCKNCDVSLTFHKQLNMLKCHLCGYIDQIPPMCPQCGSHHIRMLGFGTEKVEEEVQVMFPEAKVGRMDTDTTRGKYAHQNIISAFEQGDIDILVGTQMVSKGLDFEKVSVVGILNADNLMNFPDFRSHERGFQLITQIMGRAGRKDNNGIVFLQTRQPEHQVIKMAIAGMHEAFYDSQILERQQFHYPPFYRLIRISVRHKKIEKATSAAVRLQKQISGLPGIIILGPEEPYYGRVKTFFIRDILIKVPRTAAHANTRTSIRRIVYDFMLQKENQGVRIDTDADPI